MCVDIVVVCVQWGPVDRTPRSLGNNRDIVAKSVTTNGLSE